MKVLYIYIDKDMLVLTFSKVNISRMQISNVQEMKYYSLSLWFLIRKSEQVLRKLCRVNTSRDIIVIKSKLNLILTYILCVHVSDSHTYFQWNPCSTQNKTFPKNHNANEIHEFIFEKKWKEGERTRINNKNPIKMCTFCWFLFIHTVRIF